jgi:tetratricopeptide (TPR) repeat protein
LTGIASLGVLLFLLRECRSVSAAAAALSFRTIEGRFAGYDVYRPFVARADSRSLVPIHSAAQALNDRWKRLHDSTSGQQLAQAELLLGDVRGATMLLTRLLKQESGRADVVAAVHVSHDVALLTNLSAALLQRDGDLQSLVLAFEAADRAWELAGTPECGWNRALAAERLGFPQIAASMWDRVRTSQTSEGWRHEAAEREKAAAHAAGRVPESPEFFFLHALPMAAASGSGVADLLPSDRLASDSGSALAALGSSDRDQLALALSMFEKGRDAFAREDLDAACSAYSGAESMLARLRSPVVFLVREQRVRCECAKARPACLANIRQLRADLAAVGRYPWLSARARYAEGQTLYRQGRIYEAAEVFQSALREFSAVGDTASAGLTHSVLGNTYGAAGETEFALEHHLNAIRLRFRYPGDRRRIELEDAILFLLRHSYTGTAELLLNEMAATPATDGGRVLEATLRGVIAFRKGHVYESERDFDRAHRLLSAVSDTTLREEATRSVLLAESGCNLGATRRRLVDLDAAASFAENEEMSLWLPRMLTERGIELEAGHDTVHAEKDFLRAMSILEQREPRIDQSSLMLGTGVTRESPFDHAIRLYLKQNRIFAALSVAERSMAVRISSLHARGAGVPDAFRSAVVRRGARIQELQCMLQPGEVAVAQYLLRDAIVTWIVSKTAVRAVRRQALIETLIDAAGNLHSCASHGGCADGPEVERVSTLLLRDWIESVPRGATLWIQRPPELQAIPFAMLKTRAGERLLFRNPLTSAADFATFIDAQEHDKSSDDGVGALFLAAPGGRDGREWLPAAPLEVKRAARAYASARVEVNAERGAFLQNRERYAIVHFAGHILVNDEQPLFSALVFDDGLLYFHELGHHSFFPPRLIVLSGCDSGRTPKPQMSFANVLLKQGVPSIVYTIWPVDDVVASEFAVVFHEMVAGGKSRAESLQQAAIAIWQRHPERPEAWAAFQLAGAPGSLVLKKEERAHGSPK